MRKLAFLEKEVREEKRFRVEAALKGDLGERSSRAIAEALGVSSPFVEKIRRELIDCGEIADSKQVDKRGRMHQSPVQSA